jgi:hypothetical protein
MVALGIGVFFVAGLVANSYGAEKITVRVVTAWARAARTKLSNFLDSST